MIDIHAHRGFAGQYPENTVDAVGAAVADGADAIEVDVVPSADGEPVVFHDAHLNAEGDSRGVTDGTGYVWETPRAELETLSVLDSDSGVPTLDAVCQAVPPNVTLNVELKNPGRVDLRADESLTGKALASRRDIWQPFVERVVAVLDDYRHTLLFASFADGALCAAREVVPDVSRAVLYTGPTAEGVERARRLGADAIHPPVSAVTGTRYFDPGTHGEVDIVARAAEAMWDVNAWTVQRWHEADRLTAAGVDGLIADYPDLLGEP